MAIANLKVCEQDPSLDHRVIFQVLVNMAGCYTCLKKVNNSIIYFMRAIEYANRHLLADQIDILAVKNELWDTELEDWIEKDVAVTLFNLTNALLQKRMDK
jgi:hypothetical protein